MVGNRRRFNSGPERDLSLGSISCLPDVVIAIQLLSRIHEGVGWHCKPEILWWLHIKIFYGTCDGCPLWPDILLLYCSGKTLCHIGKSRTNRGQSEHFPTVFCVSFAIWGRDTSKTLQPPGLSLLDFFQSPLGRQHPPATPYLTEQLRLEVFQKECHSLGHYTYYVARTITFLTLSLLLITVTSILKCMLIQE